MTNKKDIATIKETVFSTNYEDMLADLATKQREKQEIYLELEFIISHLSGLLDWAYQLRTKILVQDDNQYTYKVYNPAPNSGIQALEDNCPALQSIITKQQLNHYERCAIMFLYSRFGEQGEKRIHQILSKCRPYKQGITQNHINSYKEKKKLYGISCKKMQEWGICGGDCK